ncbi:MAG: gliding motility-associated C-terminal domain-containing protein [Flavobacteriales bacterium]|nr:gliding motility-associated C-terminal domain-containing protein [Flavobacteriales bacterium]MDG1767282.1 gliding motility-associated C-terminal domain-containing protein [Flavobacteriales bacterium]
MLLRLFLVCTSIFLSVYCSAQLGCPSVDAGADQSVDCNNPCTTLTADPFETGSTSNYDVASIPYNLPYPINQGTSLFIGIDDTWSNALAMPFEFCFYGNNYNSVVVGSNGVITFDLTEAGGYCPWGFNNTAPSANLPTNAIFGPYFDIDPSECGSVRYTTLGTAPCRTFVINYSGVCLFSCSGSVNSQIVLYETTNVIEVYIGNKPSCASWNSGNTLIGIQNATGTVASVPPGRNTGNWSTSNEAWRFTPAGAPIYTVNWYEAGTLIGQGLSVDVCPSEATTYTAEVIYDGCGGVISVEDDVTVSPDGTIGEQPDPSIDLSNPSEVCLSTAPIQFTSFEPDGTWTSDCGDCLDEFGVFTPAEAGMGTFVLTYTLEGPCGPISDNFNIEVFPDDDASIIQAPSFCESDPAYQIEVLQSGGSFSATCANCIDAMSGVFDPALAGIGTHTITYTIDGLCGDTQEIDVLVELQNNTNFTLPSFICESNPGIQLEADQDGGTWSANCSDCLNQDGFFTPQDLNNGTYDITYSFSGNCPDELTLSIEVINEINPNFVISQAVCESEGSVAPNPEENGGIWDADCPSCIDPNSGVVDLTTSGPGTVEIEYEFNGNCPSSANEIIQVSEQLSAEIFDPGLLCDNGNDIQLNTADPGGVFGASCGDCISNGGMFSPSDAGAGDHVVTYTISGICGDQQSLIITVEAAVDATIIDPDDYCLNFGNITINSAQTGGTWSASCGDCIDATSGVFNTTLAGIGTHSITYEIDTFCGDSDNSSIEVIPNDNSAFVSQADYCIDGTPLNFTPNIAGGSWSASCGTCINQQGFFSPALAGIGDHQVTYTLPGICGTSSTQTVTVHALPSVDFTVSQQTGCAPLNVIFTPSTNQAVQCFWGFGDGQGLEECGAINHTYNQAGTFDVSYTAVSNQGCTQSVVLNDLVTIYPNPVNTWNFGPQNPTTDEPLIELNETTGQNDVSFFWEIGDFDSSSEAQYWTDLSSAGGESVEICLRITNQNNCFTVNCKEIDVIQNLQVFIPNAFTPDNDGVNDVWQAVILGAVKYEMLIFDRWGNIVFSSEDPNEYWFGNVDGQEHYSPDGVYNYIMKVMGEDLIGREFKGHITIIR